MKKMISFTIAGFAEDVSVALERFTVKPTYTIRKGERSRGSSGAPMRQNYLTFDEEVVEDVNLSDQIFRFLSRLAISQDLEGTLLQVEPKSCHVDVTVTALDLTSTYDFSLTPEVLRYFSDLGLSFGVSFVIARSD